jgi:hypothetical protein
VVVVGAGCSSAGAVASLGGVLGSLLAEVPSAVVDVVGVLESDPVVVSAGAGAGVVVVGVASVVVTGVETGSLVSPRTLVLGAPA